MWIRKFVGIGMIDMQHIPVCRKLHTHLVRRGLKGDVSCSFQLQR